MTKKITELDALTAPATADIIEIVDDVAVTPTSKKITLDNFFKVVNSFTATTSPQDGDYIPIYSTSDSAIKRVLKSDFLVGASSAGDDGWILSSETWIYDGADDPTYTVEIAGDQTGVYSAGMRVKLTQSSSDAYFIITEVSYAAATTITMYGGTDYDLANAEITTAYYSTQKAPYGFPLDPTKWTVEVTDVTGRSQSTPTPDAWYNLGTITISIPIGVWHTSYTAEVQVVRASGTGDYSVKSTLSTANNSESDVDLTCRSYIFPITQFGNVFFRQKILTLTAKDSYYLNVSEGGALASSLKLNSDTSKTIIRAVCAYL